MLCSTAHNLILDVVTDEAAVPAGLREAFLGHVGWCSGCRDDYEQTLALRSALQTHAEVSRDTAELFKAQGHAVADGRVLEPDAAVEAIDVEAGLARLMATLEECRQEQCSVQGPHPLEDSVADLRRWVNTLEAFQEPVREAWRRGALTDVTVTPPARSQVPGAHHEKPSRLKFPAWQTMATLAAAACLGLSLLAGSLYGPQVAPVAPRGAVASGAATLERMTADGPQLLTLGEPILVDEQITELRLGGRHRVVLNQGTTVTVEADPLNQATPAGERLSWRLTLSAGEMYAEVVPGSRFEVTTSQAVATITGTKFNLRADDDATALTLVKGGVNFTSRHRADGGVDVRAGFGSVVEGRAMAATPVAVKASEVVAWAQDTRGFVDPLPASVTDSSESVSESLAGLVDLGDEALMPQIPDYRTWSYERFRDEMRPWFAEQFPWAMELEEALNQVHGIETDYLGVLVVSGDIWQFRYPLGAGERIAVFRPSAVERLAAWHGLKSDALRGGADWMADKLMMNGSLTEKNFADSLKRWRLSVLAQEAGQDRQDAALDSLRASKYLHILRSGVSLWLHQHPEAGNRLLVGGEDGGEYVDAFLKSFTRDEHEFGFAQDFIHLDVQVEELMRYQAVQQGRWLPRKGLLCSPGHRSRLKREIVPDDLRGAF